MEKFLEDQRREWTGCLARVQRGRDVKTRGGTWPATLLGRMFKERRQESRSRVAVICRSTGVCVRVCCTLAYVHTRVAGSTRKGCVLERKGCGRYTWS